jgi:hypothetical protein
LHLHRRDIPFQFNLSNSVSTSDAAIGGAIMLCCERRWNPGTCFCPLAVTHYTLFCLRNYLFICPLKKSCNVRHAYSSQLSVGRTMLVKFYTPNITLSAINAILNNTAKNSTKCIRLSSSNCSHKRKFPGTWWSDVYWNKPWVQKQYGITQISSVVFTKSLIANIYNEETISHFQKRKITFWERSYCQSDIVNSRKILVKRSVYRRPLRRPCQRQILQFIVKKKNRVKARLALVKPGTSRPLLRTRK